MKPLPKIPLWMQNEDGSFSFWPLIDAGVMVTDQKMVAMALAIVLSNDHNEAVKTGELIPSRQQLSLTAEQADKLGDQLKAAAAKIGVKPVVKN